MIRLHGDVEPSHIEPRWQLGLYLGRRASTGDEHIVIGADGIRTGRAIRAVSEIDEKLMEDVFNEGGRAEPKQKMDDVKEA
eukprot:415006-Heterocapsa_arctica.AAC.1